MAQVGLKLAQDGLVLSPVAPSWPQVGSNWVHVGPKLAQVGPMLDPFAGPHPGHLRLKAKPQWPQWGLDLKRLQGSKEAWWLGPTELKSFFPVAPTPGKPKKQEGVSFQKKRVSQRKI